MVGEPPDNPDSDNIGDATSSALVVSRPDGTLVTPDGWRDTQAPEPSWTGSCMCSELVVPDAWASTASAHAGKRK